MVCTILNKVNTSIMSIAQAIVGAKVCATVATFHTCIHTAHKYRTVKTHLIIPQQAELATIQDPWHRLKRIASIAKLLLDALAGTCWPDHQHTHHRHIHIHLTGTVVMVPFGIRAMTLRASLPTYSASPSDNMSKNNPRVRLARDVKYGPLPRNTIDIYIPPTMTHTHYPVCLFCHGGVWATGTFFCGGM